jgi:nucleotide-binding universal stress UspA family protein
MSPPPGTFAPNLMISFGVMLVVAAGQGPRPVEGAGTAMYDKLLVAIDHSEVTDRVLDAARDLALLSGGEVTVLHLREREVMGKAPGAPGLAGLETSEESKADIDAAVAKLTAAGVRARGEVRATIFGYAAREILDEARKLDAGAIIMGSRGRGDLAGLLLGSTAHKVIHLADRPVLVIR